MFASAKEKRLWLVLVDLLHEPVVVVVVLVVLVVLVYLEEHLNPA